MTPKNRRYSTPEDWIRKGKASDYILPFHVKPGQRFVILCRVSSHEQGLRRNLKVQKVKLRQLVKERGGKVVDVLEFEWSGHGPEWLDKMTDAAKVALKHDATLLAATTDRFIRNKRFYSKKKPWSSAQAKDIELLGMQLATVGVPLMTYLDPDATPAQCKSLLTKWGQEVKGKKGGRPPKLDRSPGYRSRRKEKWFPLIPELRSRGMCKADIAKTVVEKAGVTPKTAYIWIKSSLIKDGISS